LCGVRSPDKYGRKNGARRVNPRASAAATKRGRSLSPASRAAQSRLAAALSMTDIWCQRSGRQWQKACAARPAFGRNSSVTTNSTPDVPNDRNACPGATTPSPAALAALSPPPPATTTRGNPSSAAAPADSVPAGEVPSVNCGMCERSRPVAASIASDHSR
jgi:hypothetical protein